MIGLDSIRGRLTAWYTLVLAFGLLASGFVSYEVTRRQIRRSGDASLSITVRQLTGALTNEAAESRGILQVRSAIEVLTDFRDSGRPMIVLTANGREFAASPVPLTRTVDRTVLRKRITAGVWGYDTIEGPPRMRLLATPVKIGGTPYVLAVAQSLADQEQLLRDVRRSMLLSIPLALLIAAGGGYLLARKSLAPVAGMSAKARAISATNLSDRIEATNPRDELGQLATTLNELLARLEEAFALQRRFMADASHELRTPVAILQGEIDVTLSRDDRDAREYRDSLAVMRKTAARLTRIVRDVFLLARGDTGQYPVRNERFYLEEVVADTVREFRTLAAEQEVILREEHGSDIAITGDKDLIHRLVGNLVDNAIRHTPPQGHVDVRCFIGSDGAHIEVTDSGAGVPAEIRDRIFDRFFRASSTDAGAALPIKRGGAGLGLPIARWIAEIHGGRLHLANCDEGGSTFVAVLPQAPTKA